MKKYDSIRDFADGSAYVCLNGKWGYVNKAGKELIPCQYDSIENVGVYPCHNLLWVIYEGKTGIVNRTTGKEIVPCKYDFIDKLSADSGGKYAELISVNNPIKVRIGDKFGFIKPIITTSDNEVDIIDHKGDEELIAPQYENASRFANSLAAVQLHEKWGLIDETGKTVIPLVCDKNSIKEVCGQHGHLYQYVGCISEGRNMDKLEYECIRCGSTIIEQDWHWSQD